MRKIPTVFERDWDGDRSRVLDQVAPGCEWVVAGEGVATRKYDGTCVAVIEGNVFKRMEVKPPKRKRGKLPALEVDPPPGFIVVDKRENEDGQTILTGWVPAGNGPEDRWVREAVENCGGRHHVLLFPATTLTDGTYELVGPKINGNPEREANHWLVKHAQAELLVAPRTFDALAAYLATVDVEGIVWHHPDGRMAKIKGRDFGIRRNG